MAVFRNLRGSPGEINWHKIKLIGKNQGLFSFSLKILIIFAKDLFYMTVSFQFKCTLSWSENRKYLIQYLLSLGPHKISRWNKNSELIKLFDSLVKLYLTHIFIWHDYHLRQQSSQAKKMFSSQNPIDFKGRF